LRMFMTGALVGLVVALITAPALAQAVEGMTEGEFLLMLLRQVGLSGMLPDAATGIDAVEMMEDLGIIPVGGWDPGAMITEDRIIEIAEAAGVDTTGALDIGAVVQAIADRLMDLFAFETESSEAIAVSSY